jgi:enediyne biosynthesis protein E4
MFGSTEELATKLGTTGYFIDPVMTQVVFLAAKLQKPLLLEGPAGSGKTFIDVTEKMGPDFGFQGYQRGSAFVDLNNDGFMDLVVTSLGNKPRILMNNGRIRNHWIMFDLRGHTSNRDGIGAKIKVTTGSGRILYNHVTTSVGFMSSSDRRVHFGLGIETKIDHAEIRWPSGIIQRVENLAIDRIVKLEEPPRIAMGSLARAEVINSALPRAAGKASSPRGGRELHQLR